MQALRAVVDGRGVDIGGRELARGVVELLPGEVRGQVQNRAIIDKGELQCHGRVWVRWGFLQGSRFGSGFAQPYIYTVSLCLTRHVSW